MSIHFKNHYIWGQHFITHITKLLATIHYFSHKENMLIKKQLQNEQFL